MSDRPVDPQHPARSAVYLEPTEVELVFFVRRLSHRARDLFLALLQELAGHRRDLIKERHAHHGTFGEQLRVLATSRSLSAASLAHLAGLPVTRVHALLAGNDVPTDDEVLALQHVFPDLKREG